MILVIDTSSARSALALLNLDGTLRAEDIGASGQGFDLPARFRGLTTGHAITKVAVAIGPGSFTGLRAGVSFGLGVAIGLHVPIAGLRTLHLQAARSAVPAVAVAEAGRGRVYYLRPGSEPELGEPAEVPKTFPLVGWLRAATEEALVDEGLRFRPEAELRTFGAAAAIVLESAPEVAYGSLRLEYMQAFSTRA